MESVRCALLMSAGVFSQADLRCGICRQGINGDGIGWPSDGPNPGRRTNLIDGLRGLSVTFEIASTGRRGEADAIHTRWLEDRSGAVAKVDQTEEARRPGQARRDSSTGMTFVVTFHPLCMGHTNPTPAFILLPANIGRSRRARRFSSFLLRPERSPSDFSPLNCSGPVNRAVIHRERPGDTCCSTL